MKDRSPSSPLTLDAIAKLARTSKSTVSRVLSDDPRISDETRERVLRVVRRQQYRPNLFARALAGGKTGLIGVISSNIGSGFYAEVIRGIDLVFNKHGKRLLVSFAHYGQDYAALWQDVVLGGQVEGVIVVAPTSDFFKLKLPPARLPIILCAGNPPRGHAEWKRIDRVGMDNGQAMRELVAAQAARGRKTLLHAAGWPNNSDAMERQAAFTAACKDFRLRGTPEPFGIIQSDGRASMEKYLAHTRRLPEAILCFNDSIALGVLEAWHARHGPDAKPPFALTGWDDSPAAAAIGLTSVSIPFIQLGEESAQRLLRRINRENPPAKKNPCLRLSIIQRNSSL